MLKIADRSRQMHRRMKTAARKPEHRAALLKIAATWDDLALPQANAGERAKRIAELHGDAWIRLFPLPHRWQLTADATGL
jgi:hypothetical protein